MNASGLWACFLFPFPLKIWSLALPYIITSITFSPTRQHLHSLSLIAFALCLHVHRSLIWYVRPQLVLNGVKCSTVIALCSKPVTVDPSRSQVDELASSTAGSHRVRC